MNLKDEPTVYRYIRAPDFTNRPRCRMCIFSIHPASAQNVIMSAPKEHGRVVLIVRLCRPEKFLPRSFSLHDFPVFFHFRSLKNEIPHDKFYRNRPESRTLIIVLNEAKI